MKTSRFSSLLAAAVVLAGGLAATPARAELEVSFSFFHENLSPYGDWIEVGDYGYCWRPSGIDDDWAPYTDGYWSYTDAGWTWVSYEDFGPIVYHYGRWVYVSGEGWCWVPDYEWGPAWVSWRRSDDYVGWAPLPPEARWNVSVGFGTWTDSYYDIGPRYYRFCRVSDFGAPVIRSVCLPWRNNVTIIAGTVNITNISFNRSRGWVHCGGPDYTWINRHSRRHVPTLKLVNNTNYKVVNNTIINNNTTIINNNGGNRQRVLPRNVQRGNSLEVFRPVVRREADNDRRRVRPERVARVVPKTQVDRGWSMVKETKEREALRQRLSAQTRGVTPEKAPARPPRSEELSVVPAKVDPNAPSPGSTARTRPDRGRGETASPGGNRPDVANRPSNGGRERPANVTPTTRPETPDRERPGRGTATVQRPTNVPGQPAARPDSGSGRNETARGQSDTPQRTAGRPQTDMQAIQRQRQQEAARESAASRANNRGAEEALERQRAATAQRNQEAAAAQRSRAEMLERQQESARRAQQQQAAQAAQERARASQAAEAAQRQRSAAEAAQRQRAAAESAQRQRTAADAAQRQRAAAESAQRQRAAAEAAQRQRAQQQQAAAQAAARQQAAASEARRQQAAQAAQAARQREIQNQQRQIQNQQRAMPFRPQQQYQAPRQPQPNRSVPSGGAAAGRRGMSPEEAAARRGR